MPDRIRLRDLLPPCVLGEPNGLAAAGDDLLHADPARALGAAHDVAARLNETRRAAGGPWIHAGQIQALVLLTAAAAVLLRRFAADRDPGLWRAARRWLEDDLGRDTVAALRQALDTRARPPAAGGPDLPDLPAGVDADADWLLPLLLLGLAGGNRALDPVRDLIDDAPLRARPGYARAWPSLLAYLGRLPAFDAHVDSLAELLVLPQRLAPDDLLAQLLRAHEAWSPWLGDGAPPLLLAAGVLHEERRARFEGAGAAPEISFAETAAPVAGAPAATRDEEHEAVRYSHDREWMPSLVLLAKNTHVWLHQLARRYGRPVARLDQVPDEELDEIASRGVTGLWLIGIWQRSRASRTIKQRRGNPEALASAYALDEYRVADDLGGEEALADLRRRAEARGVRLAGDMVPNHTGLDGRWVVERPDLFLGLDHPPYPAYSFTGEDLSSDPRAAIHLEDHYADHSDAAIVFRRTDRATGRARYIYHGNDGTSMPWNDTAQIDYLNPAAREAVIQEVLAVARRFPVIRFDAAMVLARRHVRRLWYPAPGEGSDIPGRAAHAMSQEAFDAAMPREFWREVVDRVAQEAPDTLLLAEAFWLMEGYFVRTLGMHRVYNSAFMHMLRDRDNAKYRRSLKNVLAYDPAILQRFVNFMSNPDEATAESQFGKGEHYFGVCALMATLPGLPLLAHGQFEGYTEKYGMEYARAYRDETPDEGFLAHQATMIFPLLRERALFAGADLFRLFDLVDDDGEAQEDVFAHVNGRDGRRCLVLYNNGPATLTGTLLRSAPCRNARGDLRTGTLAEALALPDAGTGVLRLRDPRTGFTQEAPLADVRERGLRVTLAPFECRVLLDPVVTGRN
ncbi:MAG: alpha-amylase family glycosyl hydrolase [bacterium]|nr:alpha-amylase family glycosyl hydrolase [bacterium]